MKSGVIIGILAAIAVLAGAFLMFKKNSSPRAAAPGVNFSEIGNLAFGSPGLNPNTWYLTYEKAGQTDSALLKFDSQSVCLDGPCPGNIQIGERVRVDGVATTSLVLVRGLTTDISSGNGESVALYFYNPLNDLKPGSTFIQCSENGLAPAERIIPKTNTPVEDAVNLLLKGDITPAERAQGLTTDFPLSGVTLAGVSLQNGVLTLSFNDPQNQTSGGSCRATIIWNQVKATAGQFPGVEQVKFSPSTLFQP